MERFPGKVKRTIRYSQIPGTNQRLPIDFYGMLSNGEYELLPALDRVNVYHSPPNQIRNRIIHKFFHNFCFIIIIVYSPSEFHIKDFLCSKSQDGIKRVDAPPGTGKKLLCYSLKWLLNEYKVLPHTVNVNLHALSIGPVSLEQDKLINYYKKLGFISRQDDPKNMENTANNILISCNQGGRRKTRRRRH